MAKITQKMLETQVEILNEIDPTNDYSLEFSYGGIKLVKQNGSVDVTNSGFTTKSKLWDLIFAYKAGLRRGQEL